MTRSWGPHHGRELISILQQEGNMSAMRIPRETPYLLKDQGLPHRRYLTHIQWLSGYTWESQGQDSVAQDWDNSSWRWLSYTTPVSVWNAAFWSSALPETPASLSGTGGFLWSDEARGGWRSWWRGYIQGWPQCSPPHSAQWPRNSDTWLRALHCTTAPVLCPLLHVTASLLQLA